MDIEINSQNERIDIKISGSVDQLRAGELKTAFEQLNLAKIKEINIDMKEVTYIGSAGVGKLLLLYKNLPDRDSKIRIINLSEELYSMLNDMELGEIFLISKGG